MERNLSIREERYLVKTYYDILGLVPGCDAMEINKAFNAGIRAELDTIDYPRGSMWWNPRLIRINNLTAAMKIIGNGDERATYHRKLAAAGLVCSLCDGMGTIKYGRGTFDQPDGMVCLKCEACKGTGKGFELPEETK
jgi:DnaJ-class molecular chaperone